MIDKHKPKGMHGEGTEKNMEGPTRRRAIFISFIIIGALLVAVTGGAYLLQLPSEGRQVTIFTVSNLSSTSSPIDGLQGALARNFELADPNGTSFWLSDFGGKVIVLDFMATWCGPCRRQMSHLKVVWENQNYSNKIVLMSISISLADDEKAIRAFAQGFSYATWIWARDTVNLGQAYQVTAIPKTVVIDQDGYIRSMHTGVTYASSLIEEIDQLLNQGSG